jgi:hypothetical protein
MLDHPGGTAALSPFCAQQKERDLQHPLPFAERSPAS